MRVTVSIPEDLNTRWANVANKFKMTKSGMLQDLLEDVIPHLEQETAQDILKSAFYKLGNDLGGLFENKDLKDVNK